MKINNRSIILLMISLLSFSGVSAFDFSVDGLGYIIIGNSSDNKVKVTQPSSLLKYSGDIIIPSSVTYNGVTYKVTEIDEMAFYDCDEITSVSFPNSVEFIGCEAFANCDGLDAIILPNSVTTVESGAFANCSSLTTVEISESVTSLDWNVFTSCPAIESITVASGNTVYDSRNDCNAIISSEDNFVITGCKNTILPDGISSIGPYAFYGCTSLTSINLPIGLSTISYNAFTGCTGLKDIDFPSSVWSIGTDAFKGCTGLMSIYIPKRTTSIGEHAFADCGSISMIVVDPNNSQFDSRNECNAIIGKDDNTLYLGCKNTIIPEDVTIIESSAFYGCNGLVSITIPNSVTKIGNSAFENCTGLEEIRLSDNLRSVSGSVFKGCSSLVSVNLPSGLLYIMGSSFADCSSLKSIVVPSSVTRVESRAFSGCIGLTSVVVEEGNTVFDSRNDCNGIIKTSTNSLIVGCKTTVIPEGVTEIGDCAFQRADITSINLPQTITGIGNRAFEECKRLLSVVIPDSVKSIGESAFEDCERLMSAVLPSGISQMSSSLFSGCINLKSISVPDSVTKIGSGVFYNCTSLKSVILSEKLESIGSYAFCNCTSLQSIDLPSGLKTIGLAAFMDCSNMESVRIPASVVSIAASAFNRCYSLTSVTSEAVTPLAIDENLFVSRSNATLFVPEESVDAYSQAIGWCDFKEITSIKETFVITIEEYQNGILVVAIDGDEIESGFKATENSILTILAIPFSGYELDSLTINGEIINNNSSHAVEGPMTIYAKFVAVGSAVPEVYIDITDQDVYNMSGQRVLDYPKGIYIIKGKKVLKR